MIESQPVYGIGSSLRWRSTGLGPGKGAGGVWAAVHSENYDEAVKLFEKIRGYSKRRSMAWSPVGVCPSLPGPSALVTGSGFY
jgi:hypothetical protein